MLKRNILISIALVLLTFSSLSHARSWTCNASISLSGSSATYTLIPWNMSGSFKDREKMCKNHIISNWLNNKKIWKKLNLTKSDQNNFCKLHKGTFRVDYGFDRRKKSWVFSKKLSTPPCKCSCSTGWYDGNRKSCVIGVGACDGHLQGIPDGDKGGGYFAWKGNLYKNVKAQRQCKFH